MKPTRSTTIQQGPNLLNNINPLFWGEERQFRNLGKMALFTCLNREGKGLRHRASLCRAPRETRWNVSPLYNQVEQGERNWLLDKFRT